MSTSRVFGLSSLAALGICIWAVSAAAEPVRPGESDDGWTMGLIGHSVPQVLKAAQSNPYALPNPLNCTTLADEISALDGVLGPDSDTAPRAVALRVRAQHLMFEGIRGLIPHRDLIRLATGAGRKDKSLNDAAIAGWARRGFLKGLQLDHCPETKAHADGDVADRLPEIRTTYRRADDRVAIPEQAVRDVNAYDVAPSPAP